MSSYSYVVVTLFQKNEIVRVHVYGPFAARKEAVAAEWEIIQEVKDNAPQNLNHLMTFIRKIIDIDAMNEASGFNE